MAGTGLDCSARNATAPSLGKKAATEAAKIGGTQPEASAKVSLPSPRPAHTPSPASAATPAATPDKRVSNPYAMSQGWKAAEREAVYFPAGSARLDDAQKESLQACVRKSTADGKYDYFVMAKGCGKDLGGERASAALDAIREVMPQGSLPPLRYAYGEATTQSAPSEFNERADVEIYRRPKPQPAPDRVERERARRLKELGLEVMRNMF